LNVLEKKKLKYINKDFIINSNDEISSGKNIIGHLDPEDVLKRNNIYTNRDDIEKFIKKKKNINNGCWRLNRF
jgi:hypothetical protein